LDTVFSLVKCFLLRAFCEAICENLACGSVSCFVLLFSMAVTWCSQSPLKILVFGRYVVKFSPWHHKVRSRSTYPSVGFPLIVWSPFFQIWHPFVLKVPCKFAILVLCCCF
jgi:hypothetical protein